VGNRRGNARFTAAALANAWRSGVVRARTAVPLRVVGEILEEGSRSRLTPRNALFFP